LKLGRDHGGGLLHGDTPSSFIGEAAHGHPVDAAGGNGKKGRQTIRGDVDGEAMHRDPFADADADGCKFAVFHPNAGESVSPVGIDAELAAGVDQCVLDFPEMGVEVFPAPSEIENRVSHQLARPVIGRLAATIDLTDRVRKAGSVTEGRLVAEPADRVDGLVL